MRSRIIGTADVDPRTLAANPRNWREHPPRQMSALAGILESVGWVDHVLVNERTGHIIDGHARVGIALRLNRATIPVVYVDLSDDEEKLILATFDPLAEMAHTDAARLADLVEEIAADELPELLSKWRPGEKEKRHVSFSAAAKVCPACGHEFK